MLLRTCSGDGESPHGRSRETERRLRGVVSELGDHNVREIRTYAYRILYEISPSDDIVVLAVIHRRRDLENLPNKPWDDG